MSISARLAWFYEQRSISSEDCFAELAKEDQHVYIWRGDHAYRFRFPKGNTEGEAPDQSCDSNTPVSDGNNIEMVQGAKDGPVSAQSQRDRLLKLDKILAQPITMITGTMGLDKRYEMASKIPIPSFKQDALRLWFFVAIDLIAAFVSSFSTIKVSVLGIIEIIIVLVGAVFLQICRPDLVDKYYGYPINAVLGVRCGSPPAAFCRSLPTMAFISNALSRLCVAYYAFKHWDLKGGLVGCIDNGDANFCSDFILTYWLVNGIPTIACMTNVLLLGLRLSLSSDMEGALVARAASLELQNPHATALLQRAEMYAAEVQKPRRLKPLLYQCSVWVTLGFSLAVWLRIFQQITDDMYYEMFFWVTLIFMIVATWLTMFGFMYTALAVWGTIEGCLRRLIVLSEYITMDKQILPEQLDAWWRVRNFYTQTMLPLGYGLCNEITLASLVLGILEALMWLVALAQYSFENTDDNASTQHAFAEALQNNWLSLMLSVLCFFAALTAVNQACACADEQARQVHLIQQCRMHLNLLALMPKKFPPMTDLAFTQRQPPNKVHERVFPDQPDVQHGTEESEENLAKMFEEFDSYLQSSDPAPTLLGLSISSEAIRNVIMSMLSGLAIIMVTSVKGVSA